MDANGDPLIFMKVSGGDAGLYYDSQASRNYNNAVRLGKVAGLYHFAGGTDPIGEADFFIRACSPLAENDVLILDWEVNHPTPVEWCRQFAQHVHDKTGVWVIIYMNTSTCNAHDWSPVFANCALWIADYRFTPDQDVPCHHPYIAHQYTSAGGLDRDALFIDIPTLKKFGYHKPVVTPTPVPVPTPEPTPEPPTVPPVVTLPEPTPPVVVVPPVEPTKPSLWDAILSVFKKFVTWATTYKKL
jgi:hypothetical protein